MQIQPTKVVRRDCYFRPARKEASCRLWAAAGLLLAAPSRRGRAALAPKAFDWSFRATLVVFPSTYSVLIAMTTAVVLLGNRPVALAFVFVALRRVYYYHNSCYFFVTIRRLSRHGLCPPGSHHRDCQHPMVIVMDIKMVRINSSRRRSSSSSSSRSSSRAQLHSSQLSVT